MQELLVNTLMAAAAISGRQMGGNYESVMVLLFLTTSRLVAVQAIHALPGMQTHFVFVDYRVLGSRVTLGAFPGGSNQFCTGLFTLSLRAGAVHQKRGQYQGKGNHDREKYRSK
jgi:hypothetical protein